MEEKKLNDALAGVWDSLTEEQKEKARACKSYEELVALAGAEGIELPDEILDAIAGGAIFYNDRTLKYEVIDDTTGLTLDESYGGETWARKRAKELGQSAKKIDWDGVQQIRKNYTSASRRGGGCSN